jgi:hypothetical protein
VQARVPGCPRSQSAERSSLQQPLFLRPPTIARGRVSNSTLGVTLLGCVDHRAIFPNLLKVPPSNSNGSFGEVISIWVLGSDLAAMPSSLTIRRLADGWPITTVYLISGRS